MPGCLSQSREDALGATCGNFQSLKINIYPSFRNEVSVVNIARRNERGSTLLPHGEILQ